MQYFYTIALIFFGCYYTYHLIQFTRTNQLGYMLKAMMDLLLIIFINLAAHLHQFSAFLKVLGVDLWK